MRIVGLIGGMSWESSLHYYRHINQIIKERLRGLHSARTILYSVDFHDIEELQKTRDWRAAGQMLAGVARSLESAGAEGLVLCTNTMHIVAPMIEAAIHVPLIHIADSTASEIKTAGFSRVGLLGTRFTMEEGFYKDRLLELHDINVVTPRQNDREIIHRIIYSELCLGEIVDSSRLEFRRVIAALAQAGAQAIILGCTEISLLVDQRDSEIPLFDTTALHARAAAEWALADSSPIRLESI